MSPTIKSKQHSKNDDAEANQNLIYEDAITATFGRRISMVTRPRICSVKRERERGRKKESGNKKNGAFQGHLVGGQ